MTSRSYFGKMNSTLGSVVPFAMFSSGVAVLSCDHSILCSEIKVYIFFTGPPTLNFTSTVTTVERIKELGTPFTASNRFFAGTKFVAKGPKTN